MSCVSRPANQTARDSWLTAKLTCFRCYDRSDRYISWESHADVIIPEDTIRLINIGLTLVQSRRRWTNVKPTMIQRLVSAGVLPAP